MLDYTAYFDGQFMPFNQVRSIPWIAASWWATASSTSRGRSTARASACASTSTVSTARSRTCASTRGSRRTSWSGSAKRSSRATSPCARVGDYQLWQFVTRRRAAGPTGRSRRGRHLHPADGLLRFAGLYDTGAHGVVVRTRSFYPDALDPKVKNFSRMNFNLAELEASDVDPEGWPILPDSRGNLTEGVGYNLFLVTEERSRSRRRPERPPGCLAGTVFDLGRGAGDPRFGGGPPALRPLHGRRGVLHEHEPVRPAGDEGRPAPYRRWASPARRSSPLLQAWSETVGVDIVAQAKFYANKETLESQRGS